MALDAPAEPAVGLVTSSRLRLSRNSWLVVAAMAVVIVGLNLLGWGVLLGVVAPAQHSLGAAGVFGVGLGVTAFTLGMRHAFDADHIAAIDATTRKLSSDGQQPVSVGFWFALGHSSVVFGLCLLLAFGVKWLAGSVADDASTMQTVLGVVGTSVSGVFLLVIGLLNLVILLRILRLVRGIRTGDFSEHELEAHLDSRGLLSRILGGATKAIRKPRHMYPLGFLFGLGFDTATEVALLVLAGGAAAFALPWYAILVLPVLFAAGMTLFDSIDGLFMNFAYGWAQYQPVRKLYYNVVITALSVAIALIIGVVQMSSLAAEQLGLNSGPVRWVADLDMDNVGFIIVGLFVVTWVVAVLVWKFGRVEQRWALPAGGAR